jgi:hypothetical protein
MVLSPSIKIYQVLLFFLLPLPDPHGINPFINDSSRAYSFSVVGYRGGTLLCSCNQRVENKGITEMLKTSEKIRTMGS